MKICDDFRVISISGQSQSLLVSLSFFFFSSYGCGCVSLHLISYAKKWEWFNAQWICISVSSDNHWIFNYGGEKEKNPSLCLNDMVVCKSPCGPRNVTVYPLLTIHTLMYVTWPSWLSNYPSHSNQNHDLYRKSNQVVLVPHQLNRLYSTASRSC